MTERLVIVSSADSDRARRPVGRRLGPTSGVASDRASYLYVPTAYDGSAPLRLLVSVHGRSRMAARYAECFAALADRHRYAVLAPLFPESSRYQELGIGGPYRADLRLLDLIDEVAARYAVETARFDLFGYSGGAQFAHRFLYVHPERLRSVAIGAPGTVTLPNEQDPWPVGIADLEDLAGAPFNVEAVRRPRVLLLVGRRDVTLSELNQSKRAMRAGTTRLGRARTLHAAWLVAGIEHEYLEVPDAGHGLSRRILEPVLRFLATGVPGQG